MSRNEGLRVVYLSRRFNRSGYHILDTLLRWGGVELAAVVLPPPTRHQRAMRLLDIPVLASLEKLRYRAAVRYFRGEPLRFEESINRLARSNRVPVMQMDSLRSAEAMRTMKALDPDVLVLGGGWPELLPASVLEVAHFGSINTHPSLLPDFRGTDIHRWQILEGATSSGITIHYMDESFDTGAILGQRSFDISIERITPQGLFDRAARMGGPLMVEVLERIAKHAPDRVPATTQRDREDASRYYSAWSWFDEGFMRIDWTDDADRIVRFVRACAQESYTFGGPLFSINERSFLLRKAAAVPATSEAPPGTFTMTSGGSVAVHTGDPSKVLLIEQVQPGTLEGRNFRRARDGRSLTRFLGFENVGYVG